MKRYNFTKEQLTEAINNSLSIRQALLKLGVVAEGGNYRVIHKAIKKYNLNIDHFKQQSWAKNKKFGPKRKIEDYLSNKFFISSYKLKNRLLKENFFSRQCSKCQLTTWLGEPIPLELDHINGKHDDNTLSNLRLLCPNCHALTDNYRGKNQQRCLKLGSV